MGERMKRCYVCKENKSLVQFYKDRTRPDGYTNRCKECDSKKRLDYYYIHSKIDTSKLDISNLVDIYSKSESNLGRQLSNLNTKPFIFDDIECMSIESVLQAFKFEDIEEQKNQCSRVGYWAKKFGYNSKWKEEQKLYWKGQTYIRSSREYKDLLYKLFWTYYFIESNKDILLKTGTAKLTHSIGKKNINDTVLTKDEFTSILTNIREELRGNSTKDEDLKKKYKETDIWLVTIPLNEIHSRMENVQPFTRYPEYGDKQGWELIEEHKSELFSHEEIRTCSWRECNIDISNLDEHVRYCDEHSKEDKRLKEKFKVDELWSVVVPLVDDEEFKESAELLYPFDSYPEYGNKKGYQLIEKYNGIYFGRKRKKGGVYKRYEDIMEDMKPKRGRPEKYPYEVQIIMGAVRGSSERYQFFEDIVPILDENGYPIIKYSWTALTLVLKKLRNRRRTKNNVLGKYLKENHIEDTYKYLKENKEDEELRGILDILEDYDTRIKYVGELMEVVKDYEINRRVGVNEEELETKMYRVINFYEELKGIVFHDISNSNKSKVAKRIMKKIKKKYDLRI